MSETPTTSKISVSEYRLRSNMRQYQWREARLMDDLRRELDETCYVSFSAGKDSSVIAHACQLIRPGIPMLMVDPGTPVHWTDEERERWLAYASAQGWSLKLFAWDKFAQSRPTEVAEYRRSVHEDMFSDLEVYASAHGLTRRVMGLRAEESRERRMSLGRDRGNSSTRLCPIGLWETPDVWTYIVRHSLPWLSIYDHLGPSARNGLIGRNGLEHGRLEYLRRYYPDAWRIACAILGGR